MFCGGYGGDWGRFVVFRLCVEVDIGVLRVSVTIERKERYRSGEDVGIVGVDGGLLYKCDYFCEVSSIECVLVGFRNTLLACGL